MSLTIAPASVEDIETALPFIQEIINAGETYVLPPNMTKPEIVDYFFRRQAKVFKAVSGDDIVGVCYLRANQDGNGRHVGNAGFMVSPAARGKGVARRMAEHVLETAKEDGFMALQFNFVVSANAPAVHLWKDLGFDIVGTLPKAFHHPKLGKVDAFVMYRFL